MRVEDWPERLADFIETYSQVPFDVRENNCALFCARAVMAITSPLTDLVEEVRQLQSTRHGQDLRELARQKMAEYGFQEVPILQSQRGDVVLFEVGQEALLGVCTGDKIACPGEDGLEFFGLETGQMAWRIE